MLKLNKKGFTLIELLVVIAIIAVLASIVLVSLNTARVKGRDARRIADIKSVQNALELYFDAQKKYPAVANYAALGTPLAPTYIPALPNDPKVGATYYYGASDTTSNDNATSYHLGAIMEGISGSEGAMAADADYTDTGKWLSGSVFHGKTTNCSGTSETSPDQCYDVTN